MHNIIQFQDENVIIYKDCIYNVEQKPNIEKASNNKSTITLFLDKFIAIIDQICMCSYNLEKNDLDS